MIRYGKSRTEVCPGCGGRKNWESEKCWRCFGFKDSPGKLPSSRDFDQIPLIEKRDSELWKEIFSQLPVIIANTLYCRFEQKMTLKQVGKLCDRSPEQVRQREIRGLSALRSTAMREKFAEIIEK